MVKKITKNTKISEALQIDPQAAEILFKAGLMCVGCPMSMQETIEQGCLAHGIEKKEINKIIERLNK